MNDDITSRFFAWMDREHIKPSEICDKLGNSPNTVSTWRSKGIPKAKAGICELLMTQDHVKKIASAQMTLALSPSYEEFTAWNKASMKLGMTIEDWATSTLDKEAKDYFDTNTII